MVAIRGKTFIVSRFPDIIDVKQVDPKKGRIDIPDLWPVETDKDLRL